MMNRRIRDIDFKKYVFAYLNNGSIVFKFGNRYIVAFKKERDFCAYGKKINSIPAKNYLRKKLPFNGMNLDCFFFLIRDYEILWAYTPWYKVVRNELGLLTIASIQDFVTQGKAVRKGEIGPKISNPLNLQDCSWGMPSAYITEKAMVYDSYIEGLSVIKGQAIISSSFVDRNCVITDYSIVRDSRIGENSRLFFQARVVNTHFKGRLNGIPEPKKVFSLEKYELLTNEEDAVLRDVYLKTAETILGLTEEEKRKIKSFKKVKPPFPVDKNGRAYYVQDNELYCVSVNPVDLFMLRENQAHQTCMSYLSDGYRGYGMRTLFHLFCSNTQTGCIFKIKGKKKCGLFRNIKPFYHYIVEKGEYFQYDKNHVSFSGWTGFESTFIEKYVGEIVVEDNFYGHDGSCLFQEKRQKDLAVVETYVKPGRSWLKFDFSLQEAELVFEDPNNVVITNNYGGLVLNKEKGAITKGCFKNESVKELLKGFAEQIYGGKLNEEI